MRGVSARRQRKTPTHRCQALTKPQSSQGLWGSTLGAVPAECSSRKVSRGVHASHEGLLPDWFRDVTESLYRLPLGWAVLPPSPRSDN